MLVPKLVGMIKKIEISVLLALGVGATLIMFANAAGRYLLQTSFVWAEEAIRICFVWAMFIAITDSFIRNEHIGFRNIADMNAITRFVADAAYGFSLVVVGAALAYYGWKYNGMTGDVPLAGTNLPSAILMLPGIFAGGAWFLIGCVRIVGLASTLFSRGRKSE